MYVPTSTIKTRITFVLNNVVTNAIDEAVLRMKERIPVLPYLSREKLSAILAKIPGRKDLIIDPNIIKPLENIIQISVLRSYDVDKLYKVTSSRILSNSENRVFLIYSDLILVKFICDHINAEYNGRKTSDVRFYLILVPRKAFSVMQLLEEEGVYEHVTVFAFSWELIPLDNDSVLSLEFDMFFRNLFVHDDQSLLPTVAKSLWSSFLLWGNAATRISIGTHSQSICRMVDKYFDEIGRPKPVSRFIDCCIVIDRSWDYLSPLLTPVTYTSLLDEVFGIKSGFVQLAEGLVVPLSKQNIYSHIRNRHFAHVISYLKEKARNIQNEHSASQKLRVQEMKQYVRKTLLDLVEEKKALSQHISACEMIIKRMGGHFELLTNVEEDILRHTSKKESTTFIENCITMNLMDKFSVLRLMCLLSLTQCGLGDKANQLRTQFLNTYGYHLLPLLLNLEKLGLFTSESNFNFADSKQSGLAGKVANVVPISAKKKPLQEMVQKLKLIPVKDNREFNTVSPSAMNYVFGGLYTPAACELVRSLHCLELTKEDVSKSFTNTRVESFEPTSTAMNTFFVYFVGGVTYAEVAAFQLFEKLSGCQVIIGATNMINGNHICKSCGESTQS